MPTPVYPEPLEKRRRSSTGRHYPDDWALSEKLDEFSHDAEIAMQCLKEIEEDPDSLVRGEELRRRLDELTE